MNPTLKNFPASFGLFINHQGKYIVFTCLFYALWLTRALAESQDFELHSFAGRMIGGATMEGYNVSARVSLFYKCVGVLLGSFFILNLLGYFIFRKAPALLRCVENSIVNYTALAGLLFFFFQVFEFKLEENMEILYFLQKLMLA